MNQLYPKNNYELENYQLSRMVIILDNFTIHS